MSRDSKWYGKVSWIQQFDENKRKSVEIVSGDWRVFPSLGFGFPLIDFPT